MGFWRRKPKREDPRDTMQRLYGSPSGEIDPDKVWEDREDLRDAQASMYPGQEHDVVVNLRALKAVRPEAIRR